ncbi:hypothetical protein BSKO_03804 [Bryopsis sp. KO-2023]|nr:hypothetical protein BSKO_03804 [Bryopsis sp. KO-2023]
MTIDSVTPAQVPKRRRRWMREMRFDRMKAAVVLLLEGLGENPSREGLRDTPERVVKAWQEMTSGYKQSSTDVVGRGIFNEPDLASRSSSGVVCVRDIHFASTSSENLLPFFGRCHVAYAPQNGAVLGLSKFARLIGLFSKKIQSQHQLTTELVRAISREVNPKGVAVIVEAQHLGFRTVMGSPVITFASNGSFETDMVAQQEMRAAFLLNGVSSLGKFASTPHSEVSERSFLTEKNSLSHEGIMLKTALEALLTGLDLNGIEQGFRVGVGNCVDELLHATAGYGMSISSIPSSTANTSTSVDNSEVLSEATGWSTPRDHGSSPSPPSVSSTDTENQLEIGTPRWNRESGIAQKDLTALSQCLNGTDGIEGGCFQFQSMCEHHLLPFQGRIYIGYIPKSPQATLPKHQLEAIVSMYSLRLQLQERITEQIALAIEEMVEPVGLVVMGRASHMCMVARGVRAHSSTTVNTVVRGEKTASILEQGVSAMIDLVEK